MPQVNVPGLGIVNFPDDTPVPEMERAIRDTLRERSQNDPALVEGQREAAGWLPNAAVEGAANWLGLPSAVAGLTGAGVGALARGAGGLLGMAGVEGAPEAGRAASDVLARGAARLDQRVGSGAVARGLRAIPEMAGGAPIANVRPETGAGRIGFGAVTGALPAIAAPGSMLANAAVGGASGALGATVAEAGGGPLAQAAASLLPPALAAGGAALARKTSPLTQATQTLEDLTPQERALLGREVPRRMQEARQALGTGQDPALTWAEAAQAALGRPVDTLQKMQGMAASSYGGGRVLSQVGGRSEGAARRELEATRQGLRPSDDTLEQAGPLLRDAADYELGGLSRAARAPAVALYDLARREVASDPLRQAAVDAAVNRAVAELDRVAAGNPFLTAQAQRLADRMAAGTLDWDSMNLARRSIREATQAMTERGRVLDEDLGREAGRIITDLTEELRRAVPTLRQADMEYQQAMRRVVEPAKAGPLGSIARTDDLDQQARQMTRNPSPRQTEEVMGRLAGPAAQRRMTDLDAPEVAGALLSRAVEQRLAPLQANPAGSRAASFVEGMTPTERANMRALFVARPGGEEAWRGFSRLMDTLEAMSYRPRRAGAGSEAALQEQAAQMQQGSLVRWALSPVRMLGDAAERFRMNGSTRQLAENLVSEDGFRTLHRLAAEPDAIRRAYLARSIIALGLPEDEDAR